MRGRLIPLIVCFVLLGGLATVALGQVGRPSPARAAAVHVGGAFEISDSVDGAPIFAATGLAPGGSVHGKVSIEDPGSVPVALKLERGKIIDTPGIGGGVLSARLQLTVTDVTKTGAPRTVYSGRLDSMPAREAGKLQPGGKRTYEFVATLPDGAPSAQNALQSSSTTIAYSWVAEEASGGEEKAPKGEEAPAESAPAGTPGTAAAGGTDNHGAPAGEGAGAGAGVALGLTVPRILPTVAGGRLVTIVNCDAPCRIFVRGKLRATAAGHHRTAKIHFNLKRPYTPGSKKLRIPIPRAMRNWLRRMPASKGLKAKLRFVAIGTAGGRDVVKKKVRLRVRHH